MFANIFLLYIAPGKRKSERCGKQSSNDFEQTAVLCRLTESMMDIIVIKSFTILY